MCKTGAGAVTLSSARADTEPKRRRSNHEWMDDEAGRRRLKNAGVNGGRRVCVQGCTFLLPPLCELLLPAPTTMPPQCHHNATW